MLNYFQSGFKLVCRQTLKKALEKQFLSKKEALKTFIRENGVKLSITADGRTSPVIEPFLRITGNLNLIINNYFLIDLPFKKK